VCGIAIKKLAELEFQRLEEDQRFFRSRTCREINAVYICSSLMRDHCMEKGYSCSIPVAVVEDAKLGRTSAFAEELKFPMDL
jgi:hypothetical protein